MYDRVAVALGGSPLAEQLVELAARLAMPGVGRVDLVHVHEEPRPAEAFATLPIEGWEPIAVADPANDVAVEQEADLLRDLALEVSRTTGLVAETHLLRGDPARELVRYARRSAPDLVVAAARSDDAHPDRVTSALLRRSGAPVLLLRGRVRPAPVRIARILVALDGTPFSACILAPVIDLARATGATISLLRAPGERLGVRYPEPDCQEYLRTVRAGFPGDLPLPDLRRPIHSDPATAILREAQCGYDLIAMATHGWGGPREWVIGSTTRKVLSASHIPVLMYHPANVAAAREVPAFA
jgi:nucleotide-binding universal stress UspA family protein